MNTEALFLFLILLLGLLLCSFLGGNCGREGFTGKFSGTFDVDGNSTGMQSSSGASTSSSNQYDNYNHYTGSSTQLSPGTTFYGENGRTATVIAGSDGTQSLQIILPSSSTPVTFTSQQVSPNASTPDTFASQKSKSKSVLCNVESYTNYSGQDTTYYGPNGATAKVITTDNGQQAVQVATSSGTYYYNTSGSQSTTDTSTQYYGSTGSQIQKAPDAMAYKVSQGSSAGTTATTSATPKNTSTDYAYSTSKTYTPYGGETSQVQGNADYYSQGSSGSTIAGTTPSDYYSALPAGIPRSQIPSGQEDLYILKSQVVPPVCPACPASTASCPRQETCPPCPACARCPEPSFECKKVPNYSAIDNNYLPSPVLNDFSQFGM